MDGFSGPLTSSFPVGLVKGRHWERLESKKKELKVFLPLPLPVAPHLSAALLAVADFFHDHSFF